MKNVLPLGKLDYTLLETLLQKYRSAPDPRVIVGPGIGNDSAVIEFSDRYLVLKTDPITFATDEIGWYAVNVNANDIAVTGATPKWFMATVLLPEKKSTYKDAESILHQITEASRTLGISLIGGHTEVTYNIDRPIITGVMAGEVAKGKLVKSCGAKPGDAIILTKGIAIEGTSIIAREKYKELITRGHNERFINHCRNFLHAPGLSVVKDALLAARFAVHAMHDPTEGGLFAGLFEIAKASRVGILINQEKIPVFPETQTLCKEFHLDPFRTIASGALVIIASFESANTIISLLKDHDIIAVSIGEVKERGFGLKISVGGKLHDLEVTASDEITKLY